MKFNVQDGLQIELKERNEGPINNWSFGEIQAENAIKEFGGDVLYSAHPHETTDMLKNILGFIIHTNINYIF